MVSTARLLGLAFASADLLLEVDDRQRIVFALGPNPSRKKSLVGASIADLFEASDQGKIERLIQDVRPGERRGPAIFRMSRADGVVVKARLSLFALPDLQPNLSCALTWSDAPAASASTPTLAPEAFGEEVRDLLSSAASQERELSIALLEINGLIEAQRTLPPARMASLLSQIQDLIARSGGAAATKLTPERFAILCERGDASGDLDELLQALRALSHPAGASLAVAEQSVVLSPGPDPLHQFRAVRTALNSFLDAGLPKDEAELHRRFAAALNETARSAKQLSEIIGGRRFDLHYQPVVDLATETAVHHEVLVRFDKTSGPAPMIKLAEDLALIEAIDGLVLETAVARLRAAGAQPLELAVNVSGKTLMSDAFLERLLGATNSDGSLRRRLHLEITESAALEDLEAAGRRIRALGEAGFQVAIDDFGAGAASFEYLRALPVSSVKIDGRYVRGIDRDPRAQAIVKYLVGLCSELRYTVVAEMIEREPELDTVKTLGVSCGQGWLFGRPASQPLPPVRHAPLHRARRLSEPEPQS